MKKCLLILLSFYFLLNPSFIFSQPVDGLIGYWPFTGNANDLSGFHNNGKVYNASLTLDRFGVMNQAFYFNGINSYIDFGNSVPQITNQLTISAWFKTDSQNLSSIAGRIIVCRYGWGALDRGFGLSMNEQVFFWGKDQTGSYNSLSSSPKIMYDNNWHHLVGTVINSIWEYWIDGVKVGSLNNGHSNVDITQSYNLYVGNLFNGGSDVNIYFKGSIDDIRIYNRALSSLEILQLYTEGSSSVNIYNITTSSNPINGGNITGDGSFLDGQTATLTAKPNQDYLFINWTENNNIVSTNTTYQFAVNKNRTLEANFKNTKAQVTASTNPFVGGSVSGIGVYAVNQSVKITANSFPGYKFLNWTEAGIVVSSDSSYTFIADKDRILVANFIPKASAIDPPSPGLPTSFYLYQNYPNPFNPSTKIRFSISSREMVKLNVFDLLGKEVAELVNRELSPGTYSINFDASNLNTGVYFYTIQAGAFQQTRKLILMK